MRSRTHALHYSVNVVAVVAPLQDRVQKLDRLAVGLVDLAQIQLAQQVQQARELRQCQIGGEHGALESQAETASEDNVVNSFRYVHRAAISLRLAYAQLRGELDHRRSTDPIHVADRYRRIINLPYRVKFGFGNGDRRARPVLQRDAPHQQHHAKYSCEAHGEPQ